MRIMLLHGLKIIVEIIRDIDRIKQIQKEIEYDLGRCLPITKTRLST